MSIIFGRGSRKMVVYLDGVIALNFLVDLLLLMGVNRLAGHPPGLRRVAAGAMVGGGYAGMCMVPSLTFLTSGLWKGISLGLVSMAAFGMDRSAVRRGVLFVLLSMALGGLVMSFDTGNFFGLILCAGALALLCRLGFQGKTAPRRLLETVIRYGGKEARLLALRDTGNTLRDPVTGEGVLVVQPQTAWELAGLTERELKDPVTCIGRIPGARLIPYHAVGGGGMLLGLRCDSVTIGGRPGGCVVAFSPEAFPAGEYQALTGGQYE